MRSLKRHIILIIGSLLLLGQLAWAQDPHFSQFYHAPLWLNPSGVAMQDDVQLNLNYRSQWASVVQPFVTPQVSLMYPFLNSKDVRVAGAGLSLISDKAGDGGFLTTTGLNGAFAFNFPLAEGHFAAFGMSAGYLQKSLSINALTTENQFIAGAYDPTASLGEQFSNTQVSNLDFNTGLTYYFMQDSVERLKAGLSFHHLNEQKEIFINQTVNVPLRWVVHGEYKLAATKQYDFAPSILYMSQANAQSLNLGAMFRYKFNQDNNNLFKGGAVGIGSWYRVRDALVFALQLEHKNFILGFSYDVNVSGLNSQTAGRGATEISIVLRNPVKGLFKGGRRDTVTADTVPQINTNYKIALTGIITEMFTNEPMYAKVVLKNRKGQKIDSLYSRGRSGAYRFYVKPNAWYRLEVDGGEDYEPVAKWVQIGNLTEEEEFDQHFKLKMLVSTGPIIMENVLFEHAVSKLLPQSFFTLQRLAEDLLEAKDVTIEIRGHTDASGGEETNMKLSIERAQTVANYLIEKGVPKEQIIVKGFGETQPIADNNTPEGRQANRRVEFRIIR